ncbi:MAG: hypothetical protein H0W75_09485, partial [Chitinophagaceae bacterium]|nr:hypothetical protein [Chitinophagaceae bacterium]
MAYGTKYICTFDNLRLDIPATPVFTIEFQFKEYEGEAYNIKGAAEVLNHSWETDDPHATIKGSSLAIGLINEAQTVPLLSFLSLEDDGVKVRLLWNGQLMFEGFLVQDDCMETMVDFNHEINLTANDNLGLLKNVSLDKAPIPHVLIYTSNETYEISGYEVTNDAAMLTPAINALVGFGARVLVGDKISVNGAGPYIVDLVSYDVASEMWFIHFDEFVPSTGGSTIGSLGIFRQPELTDLMSLLTLIKRCLSATGLTLSTTIYSNIYEETQDPAETFLDQTLINPQVFLKGDTEYEDCYTVLEKILKRFNLTIFQSTGIWNIVRWDELKNYNNLIPGFSYDSDFNYVGAVALPAPINCGIGQNLLWESAPDHRIFRPYLFDKETFNYK